MPTYINADDGIVSGVAGLKYGADNSGSLVLQTNGTTAITISAAQVVTFTNAVNFATASFTNLAYTGTLTGGTGVVNLGSGQFYKDASGNIGIGTSTPNQKLEVSGGNIRVIATGSTDGQLFLDTTSTSAGALINFGSAGTANKAYLGFGGSAYPFLGGNNSLSIYNIIAGPIVFGTNNAERIRITSVGDVGVNINYGLSKLTVAGTSAGANGAYATYKGTITINETNLSSLESTGGLEFKASVFGAGYGAKILCADDGQLLFGNRQNSASWSEKMRIDGSGNLLVGTTSAYGVGPVQIIANTGAQLSLRHASSPAGKYWKFGPDSSANNLTIFNQNGTGQYMVDGGTSWIGTSDERLKTDLLPIENAANKVSTLRAVTGRFKTDEEGTSRSFLIAQDLQKVFPEAVKIQDDELGTLGISYTDVIPLLVASIQEQQALITSLTTRLTALESK